MFGMPDWMVNYLIYFCILIAVLNGLWKLLNSSSSSTKSISILQTPLQVWFYSTLPLSEIGIKLQDSGLCKSFHYDSENEFGMILVNTSDTGQKLYLSRFHDSNEPVRIWQIDENLKPISIEVDKLAKSIAKTLQLRVTVGHVESLSGEEFKYHAVKTVG